MYATSAAGGNGDNLLKMPDTFAGLDKFVDLGIPFPKLGGGLWDESHFLRCCFSVEDGAIPNEAIRSLLR